MVVGIGVGSVVAGALDSHSSIIRDSARTPQARKHMATTSIRYFKSDHHRRHGFTVTHTAIGCGLC